jgi:superfamily II DNA helicase RecQ
MWRNALLMGNAAPAEKQGIPVYAVFTNDHLANMIKNKITGLKDIAALPGVGESRVKQYGEQFLKILTEHSPGSHETAEQSF